MLLGRRHFLLGSLAGTVATPQLQAQAKTSRMQGTRIRLALNAYSFNQPLTSGAMTLLDVVDFCASHGIDGLDATGYYFPGYPQAPAPYYVAELKRKAFVHGITISGTGVRNDFAVTDGAARARDLAMVKGWIGVASNLGAGVIRVFSGRKVPDGYSFDQTLEWMTPLLQECAEHGERHGVIVGLQNHDDFVKTAAETIRLVEAVDSPWFKVILDVGSLRQHDPYEEIEKLLPYAVSWQLKENVYYGEKARPTDYRKIKEIIERVGYRGFLPIETLGPGDPEQKLTDMLKLVRQVFPV
jgi:sugar phosphate isomerase/epimerase